MVGTMSTMTAIVMTIAARYARVDYGAQWRALRPAVAGAAPAWLVTRAIVEIFGGDFPLLAAGTAAGGGAAAYLAVVFALEKNLRHDLTRAVRSALIAQEGPSTQ
jgi:hypothetical protein